MFGTLLILSYLKLVFNRLNAMNEHIFTSFLLKVQNIQRIGEK